MISKEAFRRKCEEKIPEGNPFIGIAYNGMSSFLFIYTGEYRLNEYHYSYEETDRYGRGHYVDAVTYDKHLYEAVQRSGRYKDLTAWEEIRECKARKGDITKLRKIISRLEKSGRLDLMAEYDGKKIVKDKGGVFNV